MHRRAITLRGLVQGVGFRPFVYTLASSHRLQGFVRNQSDGVQIEVEGDSHALDEFIHELTAKAPPLARIEEVQWEPRAPLNEQTFRILSSAPTSDTSIFISPDLATCDDCLAELFDPANRRYRYPFLNCTNCGPRLTIIKDVPYDRERTTMAPFPMCSQCRAEFEDPTDRRFHAEPTACPVCGPLLELLNASGERIQAEETIAFVVDAVRQGRIGALKGLGGFHLMCDARNGTAVDALRHRKQRDEKPFAVMVETLGVAEQFCLITPEERKLLLSRERPIVLLRKRSKVSIARNVAPGNPCLGVMLPYTPLHHLLLRGTNGLPLVMTSGNPSDEPIAYDDRDALRRLGNVADFFLTHDRRIHLRCDDSVTRVIAGHSLLLRRSRGFSPAPVSLPGRCARPILALGGQLKTTFALGRGQHAFLSHHLGDLDYYEAYREYAAAISHYERLFAFEPEVLVHDLHPDYASTRYALARSEQTGVKCLSVQHHHAHMASGMAEHGLTSPVIGVSFDGTGFGTDGAIWGGEFLAGDFHSFNRVAHLRYVGMPGGDLAIREPWRMALTHLVDAGQDPALLSERISIHSIRLVQKMLDRRVNCPLTSSCGRLFDAIASLIGLRERASYEGQPAMELEWLASAVNDSDPYRFELTGHDPIIIDTRAMIAAVVRDVRDGVSNSLIAHRVHSTILDIIVEVCRVVRERAGLKTVVLSGGVFMNAILTSHAHQRLGAEGFDVFSQRQVPPNDGGLALGQLAVAAAYEV